MTHGTYAIAKICFRIQLQKIKVMILGNDDDEEEYKDDYETGDDDDDEDAEK